MSRIAALTAVLTMMVAPTAFADGPGQPNINDIGKQVAPAVVDLRSPDAATPVRITAPVQDLRSPDAVDVFVASGRNLSPSVAPQANPSDDGFNWGIAGIVAAALAACAVLAVMLRRHLAVGGPVGV